MQLEQKKITPRYAWCVVGMLWCICVLNYADRQVLSSVFPVIEREFALSKFQLGMIGSIFMWVYAGTSFFAGYLSDRFKRKPLILIGCFFWSLIAIATGKCTSFLQFFTMRAFEGLGESIYFPASNSLISDIHLKKNRSKAFGVHQSGVYLGTIIGSWIGAFLAQHYNWSYGFYLFGGLGILLSFVFFFFLKEPIYRGVDKERSLLEDSSDHLKTMVMVPRIGMIEALRTLLKKPAVIFILLASICAYIVSGIFLVWLPGFLYEKFQMNLTSAGFFSVIFIQIASALTIPIFGCIADKLAARKRHGRLLLQIICLLAGSFTIIIVGQAATLGLLFSSMVLFGICKAGYDNGIFSALFDYIEPNVRGSAAGLLNAFGCVGGAFGPFIVGTIATYGGEKDSAMARMSMTISLSSIAYLLAALFLFLVIFFTKEKVH